MEALQSRPSTSGRKFDPVEVCPLLYTTRIATAKILIELEDWDNATKVHYINLSTMHTDNKFITCPPMPPKCISLH